MSNGCAGERTNAAQCGQLDRKPMSCSVYDKPTKVSQTPWEIDYDSSESDELYCCHQESRVLEMTACSAVHEVDDTCGCVWLSPQCATSRRLQCCRWASTISLPIAQLPDTTRSERSGARTIQGASLSSPNGALLAQRGIRARRTLAWLSVHSSQHPCLSF